MDKWNEIIFEMEDNWHNSREYKFLPIDIPVEEYCRQRDLYKAEHIYDMYGEVYFERFLRQAPHIAQDLDWYVPCRRAADAQCSMFCHKFKEGGCMSYANE